MEQNDDELVRRVLNGQTDRYSQLIDRYQRPVFNLMYRYTHSDQEAADQTQEVFLRAFEKLSKYKPGNSFFSWLYALAVNRANDWYRKNQRQMHQRKHLQPAANNMPTLSDQEKKLEKKEQLEQVHRMLDHLSPSTREILLLRYQRECSIKEVAAIFDLSESAVKMRISRGLQQLQGLMTEN